MFFNVCDLILGDIFWENLSTNTAKWYFRWIGINSILFLFLFFLTTPAYIVQIMTKLSMARDNSTDPNEMSTSPLVTEFLPTLLLWSLTALMPIVVAYSESWLSHWTRSRENYAIMTKVRELFFLISSLTLMFVISDLRLFVVYDFNSTKLGAFLSISFSRMVSVDSDRCKSKWNYQI